MNVFVLCTGRCGSMTFVRACEHMTNFTAGHETRSQILGAERFAYPADHIEADNRLSWLLGRLHEAYGDDAWYVHLTRNPDEVAASHVRLGERRLNPLRAHRDQIMMKPKHNSPDDLAYSLDMVETVTANIRHFLRDKSKVMEMTLETAGEDFPRFWRWIGAEGDLNAAVAEWSVRHNQKRVKATKGPVKRLFASFLASTHRIY